MTDTTAPTADASAEAVLPPPTEAPRRLIPRRETPYWDTRWLARRALFGAVLVTAGVFIVAGMRVVILGPEQAPVVTQAPAVDRAAEAFAVQVVTALYTWDEAHPEQHEAGLALVLGGDRPARWSGWDGKGTSTVTGAVVVAAQPVDNRVVVQVQARIAGVPRVVVVTVARDARNVPTLAAVPAFGTAPTPGVPTGAPADTTTEDSAATDAARPTVEGFLRSWGQGLADLGVYTADGYTPPGGPGMRMVSATYRVPAGGAVRDVLVLVRWADTAGRTYPSAYTLTLQQNVTQWRVAGISPAAASNPPNT